MSLARNIISLSIASTLVFNCAGLQAKTHPDDKAFLDEEVTDGEEDDSLTDFYGDEDFVSIATGSKQLIHKAPFTATVITASDINRMGAQTVTEALENVPGLHVYPSPFNRLNSSFSIRGIYTDQNPQVLFLVNGLPVREEYTGARPQTFKMPIHTVSRIEVIRGPGSAIYGADAYAGVINVITKSLTDLSSASYGASYGTFNSSNLWYQNAINLKNIKLGFSFETLKSDGDNARISPVICNLFLMIF